MKRSLERQLSPGQITCGQGGLATALSSLFHGPFNGLVLSFRKSRKVWFVPQYFHFTLGRLCKSCFWKMGVFYINYLSNLYAERFRTLHEYFMMQRPFLSPLGQVYKVGNILKKHSILIYRISVPVFWEKTSIDVSWLFLASENHFNWLTWFLVLLHTERQESRQSIEIIFTAQK